MERPSLSRPTRTAALRALAILAIALALGCAPSALATLNVSTNSGNPNAPCPDGMSEGVTFEPPSTIAVGESLVGAGVTLTSTHVKMADDVVSPYGQDVGEPISYYFRSDSFLVDAVVVTSGQAAQTQWFDGTMVGWFSTSSYNGNVPHAISTVKFCDYPDGAAIDYSRPPADPLSDVPPADPPADVPPADPPADRPLDVPPASSPADQPDSPPPSTDLTPAPDPTDSSGGLDRNGSGDDHWGDTPISPDDDQADEDTLRTSPMVDDTTCGAPSGDPIANPTGNLTGNDPSDRNPEGGPPGDAPAVHGPETTSENNSGSGVGDGTGGPAAGQPGNDDSTDDPSSPSFPESLDAPKNPGDDEGEGNLPVALLGYAGCDGGPALASPSDGGQSSHDSDDPGIGGDTTGVDDPSAFTGT